MFLGLRKFLMKIFKKPVAEGASFIIKTSNLFFNLLNNALLKKNKIDFFEFYRIPLEEAGKSRTFLDQTKYKMFFPFNRH